MPKLTEMIWFIVAQLDREQLGVQHIDWFWWIALMPKTNRGSRLFDIIGITGIHQKPNRTYPAALCIYIAKHWYSELLIRICEERSNKFVASFSMSPFSSQTIQVFCCCSNLSLIHFGWKGRLDLPLILCHRRVPECPKPIPGSLSSVSVGDP